MGTEAALMNNPVSYLAITEKTLVVISTAQKRKFSSKDFFSKCDQIWSHLPKKSLIENIFCAVK